MIDGDNLVHYPVNKEVGNLAKIPLLLNEDKPLYGAYEYETLKQEFSVSSGKITHQSDYRKNSSGGTKNVVTFKKHCCRGSRLLRI